MLRKDHAIYCVACEDRREHGEDGIPACKGCKAARRSEKAAKARAELGKPMYGSGVRSPFCSLCGSVKENQDSGYCNPCKRIRAQTKRLEDKRDPSFGENERDYKRKIYQENAEYRQKVLATLWARRAIKRGTLVRMPCEVCGHEKVDAHHDDYDKPLDVRWLCRKHHLEHHRMNLHNTRMT